MIYLTSDLHFCHDREFIWGPRGFKNVWEMNEEIVKRWNTIIDMDDDVYVLGDLMLKDNEEGVRLIKQLKGRIHIIRGNHDTDTRMEIYNNLYNIVEIADALYLTHEGYHFYLTHFPCITSNLEKESLKKATLNLYGHTHQQTNFYKDMPFMYHVGLDSHNCYPISLDEIIGDMEYKVQECINQL